MLTGKHRPRSAPAPGTRFTPGDGRRALSGAATGTNATFATVAGLQRLADEAGTPLTTLAIAWVLANPAITAPLLGASRPEQLDDTLAAVEYKLDPSLKQKLDELTADYRRGDAPR